MSEPELVPLDDVARFNAQQDFTRPGVVMGADGIVYPYAPPSWIETAEERRRLWPRRRNFTILVAGAAGLLWLVLHFAPRAHADDQSYLDGLAAEGVMINPMNSQAFLLQRGDSACRLLRAHVPPDQVAGQLGFNGWMWNQRIVDVAQRELCPDTLRGNA